jgi:hypothetical protein
MAEADRDAHVVERDPQLERDRGVAPGAERGRAGLHALELRLREHERDRRPDDGAVRELERAVEHEIQRRAGAAEPGRGEVRVEREPLAHDQVRAEPALERQRRAIPAGAVGQIAGGGEHRDVDLV